ncbi:MAG TPA: single-stranded-DNA-specific exonuclease RecJ [Peptococcaceae bacterium]|nr:single-stranded-DNA-specific exonuclease RecJ [Peptococcaceae bacterium]
MWNLSQQQINLDFADGILSPSMAQILYKRGYTTPETVLKYLRPSLFDLHSPFFFHDMPIIMLRLEKALKLKEKILIYGDYDADGVTGTALIYKVLKEFGFNVLIHIPTREEGYGLHKDIIDKAIANSITLIITVDCGISANDEIEYAANNGIDVIITDHHEPSTKLPAAIGILNPKVKDSGYPFEHLAGVGVAYKLVQALYTHFGPGLTQHTELEYLDLVALGTIADIVPLVGENRIFVKYGLKVMENTKNIGIQALLEECGLQDKKLKAGQVSFIIAPRINAAGRMDTARLALNLFLEEDYEEALELARELSKENYQRQLTEKEILQEAKEMLKEEPLPAVIVLSSPHWHHGVIGIVASRLVECYHRPVYLIAEEGEIGKGSARGIPGYHVYEELAKQAPLLLKFGGHKQAAGFSLKVSNIKEFREGINRSFVSSGLVYQEEYYVDSIVPCDEINLELQKELAQMAPFGAGNPEPILFTPDLIINNIITMGKDGEHLKLFLESGSKKIEAVAFRKGQALEELKNMKIIDIIYYLDINDYLGQEKVQAVLKDYRQANGNSFSEAACSVEEHKIKYAEEVNINENKHICLTREILVDFYKELRRAAKTPYFSWQPNGDDKLQMECLKVLEELGFVTWLGGTDPYLIRLNTALKNDLQNSLRYRMLSK